MRWVMRRWMIPAGVWLGGAVAVYLLIGAYDPSMPLLSKLIAAAAWVLLLPIYAVVRRGE